MMIQHGNDDEEFRSSQDEEEEGEKNTRGGWSRSSYSLRLMKTDSQTERDQDSQTALFYTILLFYIRERKTVTNLQPNRQAD